MWAITGRNPILVHFSLPCGRSRRHSSHNSFLNNLPWVCGQWFKIHLGVVALSRSETAARSNPSSVGCEIHFSPELQRGTQISRSRPGLDYGAERTAIAICCSRRGQPCTTNRVGLIPHLLTPQESEKNDNDKFFLVFFFRCIGRNWGDGSFTGATPTC